MNPLEDPVLYCEGVERLHRLMPEAVELAVLTIKATPAGSGLLEPMLPFMKRSNLRALLVHPAPLGGWYADLVLTNTPPGVSNIIGTPVETPRATREEAEAAALNLLVMALSIEVDVAMGTLQPKDPVFVYGSVRIPLKAGIMAMVVQSMPDDYGGEEGRRLYAERRLEELTETLFPEGITEAAWMRCMSVQEVRVSIFSAVYIAAATGSLVYPFLRPGPVADQAAA